MEKQRLQFLFQKPKYFYTLKDQEYWELAQAQISSNDCYLATNHSVLDKQRIKIWELRTQKCQKIIDLKSGIFVICMEFNSENTHFFYAQHKDSGIYIVNLLKRMMDINVITTGQYIDRIVFNLNQKKVIIIPHQQEYFEIWDTYNRQKIYHIETQNLVRNAKYLSIQNYLTISISQDDYTLYQLRDEQKQRIIKEWKGKFISGEMKFYQIKQNQLIVYFQVEFDNYIQIWSLENWILNFLIKNLIGFKLIIEDQEGDEDLEDKEVEEMDDNQKKQKKQNGGLEQNQQNLYESFLLYDLLTGKKQKGLSYIDKDRNYIILPNCIIGQRLQQKCSQLVVYQSSFPKSLQY